MFRCFLWALAAAVQLKALLIADNLCLRQQLVVLQHHKPRPRLGADVSDFLRVAGSAAGKPLSSL